LIGGSPLPERRSALRSSAAAEGSSQSGIGRIDRASPQYVRALSVGLLGAGSAIWRRRRTKLLAALPTAGEEDQAPIQESIGFIEQQLATNGGAAHFFFARMRYEYALGSPLTPNDPNNCLPEAVNPQPRAWPVRFWFGNWDADVLCGYARGTVTIDPRDPSFALSGRQARVTDHRP
jgi:hypothetical protein